MCLIARNTVNKVINWYYKEAHAHVLAICSSCLILTYGLIGSWNLSNFCLGLEKYFCETSHRVSFVKLNNYPSVVLIS